MNFPINPLPIPQRARELQLPQRYDPASVIMQAAQLQQQRRLKEQELNQNAVENAVRSLQSAQSLIEQKREAQSKEDIAKQTLAMAQQKEPLEEAQMRAHAKMLESQAKMYSGGGDISSLANSLVGMALPGPNGEPPQMTMQDLTALTSRAPWMKGPIAQAVAAKSGTGANFMAAPVAMAGQKAAATYQQGAAVQGPVRMTNAVLPSLNLLDHLMDKLPRTDLQWLNKGGIAALKANGSVIGQAVATQANNVVQSYNQQFGRGSDKKMDADADSLNAFMSPAQGKMSVALLKSDMIAKRNALLGAGYENYSTPFDSQMAPLPKYKSRDYLQSLGQDFTPLEAAHSLQTAREAGLIED